SIVDVPSNNDMSGYIPFLPILIQLMYRPVLSLTLEKNLAKYIQKNVIVQKIHVISAGISQNPLRFFQPDKIFNFKRQLIDQSTRPQRLIFIYPTEII
ncbi:MAG: hypothetical protein ACQ9MH_24015, partial [Nitrospinales bacterium]